MSQLFMYPRVMLFSVVMVLPIASANAGHISIGGPGERPLASSFELLPSDIGPANAVERSVENLAIEPSHLANAVEIAEPSVANSNLNLSPVGMMVATATTAVVPEPGTIILFGLGALGVFLAGRRQLKSS